MAKELGGDGRITSNAFVSTMPTALMLAVTASATRTWYGLRGPLAPGDDDHLARPTWPRTCTRRRQWPGGAVVSGTHLGWGREMPVLILDASVPSSPAVDTQGGEHRVTWREGE
jgi:hypothetical protein